MVKRLLLSSMLNHSLNVVSFFLSFDWLDSWGLVMFSFCELQKAFPPLDFPDLGSCNIFQSFLNNKLNSVVELAADKGYSDVSFPVKVIVFSLLSIRNIYKPSSFSTAK